MAYQPFLIADTRIGLERDIEPWLLPKGAYPELEDCYLFRGRIVKKQGYSLLGQLMQQVGTTNGAGDLTVTLNGVSITQTIPVGVSSFIVGMTVYTDGGGASPATLLTSAGGMGSATLDRGDGGNPGKLIITGAPASLPVYYVPGLPVMGLPTLESTTFNQGILMGFDVRYSYQFSTSTATWINKSYHKSTNNTLSWTGTDAQFFWVTNYANAFWTVNNNPGYQATPTTTDITKGDGIRWFDQNGAADGWVNFLPQVDGSNYLQGALIMVAYKGRLLAFSTFEGATAGNNTNYQQRARWSQNGSPYYASTIPTGYQGSFNANAWRSDIAGRGGYIDAPTLEKIASVQFVKDTLVVYFESSTWQLVYTGFEQLPFTWVKINTELGATSTFSEVPFDKIVIGIGDTGVHACDSVNVERIDQKIPDEVFSIQNENSGRFRVYGIRDYYNQLVYWTIPYVGPDQQQGIDDEQGNLPPPGIPLIYPNKILVYNYIDEAFSFFNDSFTCFGYYQKIADTTWAQVLTEWQGTLFPWASAQNQAQFPFIVAGNQLGFVEILDPNVVANSNSLFISNWNTTTNTLTVPNHNLTVGQFINITTAGGISFPSGTIFKVGTIPTANTFTLIAIPPSILPTGTYSGPGSITVLSNINIITKRFNPYYEEASQVRLGYVDFYFDRTTNGQLTVNLYVDEDGSIPINLPNNSINTYPESTYQVDDDVTPFINFKLWKRAYFEDISQQFQIQLCLDDEQMQNLNIVNSNIVLHGMILYFSKSGRLINV